jgi:hypothetical protein
MGLHSISLNMISISATSSIHPSIHPSFLEPIWERLKKKHRVKIRVSNRWCQFLCSNCNKCHPLYLALGKLRIPYMTCSYYTTTTNNISEQHSEHKWTTQWTRNDEVISSESESWVIIIMILSRAQIMITHILPQSPLGRPFGS